MRTGCSKEQYDPNIQDEAKRAGKTKEDYPTHYYNMAAALPTSSFADMDGGVLKSKSDNSYLPEPGKLNPEAVKGRNTWLIWTGGNYAFFIVPVPKIMKI